MTKDELRTQLKAQRKAADRAALAHIDARIAERVLALQEFAAAPMVLTYLSFGREVDTRAIIEAAWEAGKQVVLPRCQPEGRLSWHMVESFEGLETSSFGMDEPSEERCAAIDVAALGATALAIVPGLAFDCAGFRIGYGGGFYDRFLKDFPGVSVGLCRSVAFYDSLQDLGALEPFDFPVDIVVTE